MKRGNVSGIISVGIGAIAGTILGLPFLAMKNAIGLLGPVVGVVAGGLLAPQAIMKGKAVTLVTIPSRACQSSCLFWLEYSLQSQCYAI